AFMICRAAPKAGIFWSVFFLERLVHALEQGSFARLIFCPATVTPITGTVILPVWLDMAATPAQYRVNAAGSSGYYRVVPPHARTSLRFGTRQVSAYSTPDRIRTW